MKYLKHLTITLAVDGSGDFTTDTLPVSGRILQIRFIAGTLDTGGDLTVVGKDTGVPILTMTAHGTANRQVAPRQATHDILGVASDTDDTTGEPVEDYIWVNERLTVTEDDGGISKTGTLHIWVG